MIKNRHRRAGSDLSMLCSHWLAEDRGEHRSPADCAVRVGRRLEGNIEKITEKSDDKAAEALYNKVSVPFWTRERTVRRERKQGRGLLKRGAGASENKSAGVIFFGKEGV